MGKEVLYRRAGQFREKLVRGRKRAFERGWNTGFHVLDQIASFKKNYQTLVFAPPHVGKSVITTDLLMAQAEMGRKICIYSPEFIDEEEMFYSLIQSRISKNLNSKHSVITDEEFVKAINFVDEHFIMVSKPTRKADNSHTKITLEVLFRQVADAEKEYNTKFDFLFIDPMNYLERTPDDKFLQTADYVLSVYEKVTEFSKLLGLHTIMSAHTRDVEMLKDKETGIRYYDTPHPSEVVGGQSNYRAGFQILALERKPEGVLDPNGIPYPANYTVVHCQKTKPFGVGKIENTGNIVGMDGLYFDPNTFTMYEIVEGEKYYRNEYYNRGKEKPEQKSAIQPNLDFGADDAPF